MTLTIPGIVQFEPDPRGLARLLVTNAFATAEIYLLGGQVTRFQPLGEEQVLWLSPLSSFTTGKAIRGGVPICWPWFGPHPSRPDLPAHGFARIREWRGLDAAQLADGRTRLRLILIEDEATLAAWPHPFSLILSVTVGAALELELAATNTGSTPLSYTDALHTYLRVGEVGPAAVLGLDGAAFVHSTRHYRGVQKGPVGFGGEVNNIHVPDLAAVDLLDPVMKRRIAVIKGGSLATVVWNPGEALGAAMKDVGTHWNEFVCIEAANCADAQVVLLPGTSHTTSQTIRVMSL